MSQAMGLRMNASLATSLRPLPNQLRGAHTGVRSLRARPQKVRVQGPTVALFNFGAPPVDPKAKYICVDCGYIYDGRDFSKEPNSYTCPYCTSKKRRFKMYKGRGSGNSQSARMKRFEAREW